jgi:phage shock protein A
MQNVFVKGPNGPKSFWQKPEGVTGFLFLAGIIIGGGYALYKLLPYIVSILQNTLHAVILFVVLGAVLYILFDPKFRNLIWFMYKSLMRAITSVFVNIDPIGILESYIENLHKNLQEMDGHIAKLKGQIQKMKTIIEKNDDEMKESLQMAEQAKKAGNKDIVVINTRQYGRLEESNKRFAELLTKMEILYRVLSKMYDNSGFLIQDIENEVRIKKQEREAIRSGYSAMRRAMSIINGDPDKKMLFDQAMDAIVDDISGKIGEMERFMEVSSSFIESIDLQNGVYEQKGMELLEKMEKEGISLLLNNPKNQGEPVILKRKDGNDTNTNNDTKYKNLF